MPVQVVFGVASGPNLDRGGGERRDVAHGVLAASVGHAHGGATFGVDRGGGPAGDAGTHHEHVPAVEPRPGQSSPPRAMKSA